jgi:Domain of unknown function (DUF4258)
MQDYELTAHARTVIAERSIKEEWIKWVMLHPEKVEPDREDQTLQHALGRISENQDRVLRIIYNQTVTPYRIVTAYFDRARSKKL